MVSLQDLISPLTQKKDPQRQMLEPPCKLSKQYHRTVQLSCSPLNGHTLGFHPQTQKIESLHNTTGKHWLYLSRYYNLSQLLPSTLIQHISHLVLTRSHTMEPCSLILLHSQYWRIYHDPRGLGTLNPPSSLFTLLSFFTRSSPGPGDPGIPFESFISFFSLWARFARRSAKAFLKINIIPVSS